LTQNPFPYLSFVPDMKSPLSDIFILAPLFCQNRVLYINNNNNNNNDDDNDNNNNNPE
jgi:hypothetical protein